MRSKFIAALAVVLSAATTVLAQTKISGTVTCSKPDEVHAVEVGDRPNHSISVGKCKCSWTKPLEIGGAKSTKVTDAGFNDVTDTKVETRGYFVIRWANGDKSYLRYQGFYYVKGGTIDLLNGTWSFTGGTGKLRGLMGKGTYKPTGAPDSYELEGEYELPK